MAEAQTSIHITDTQLQQCAEALEDKSFHWKKESIKRLQSEIILNVPLEIDNCYGFDQLKMELSKILQGDLIGQSMPWSSLLNNATFTKELIHDIWGYIEELNPFPQDNGEVKAALIKTFEELGSAAIEQEHPNLPNWQKKMILKKLKTTSPNQENTVHLLEAKIKELHDQILIKDRLAREQQEVRERALREVDMLCKEPDKTISHPSMQWDDTQISKAMESIYGMVKRVKQETQENRKLTKRVEELERELKEEKMRFLALQKEATKQIKGVAKNTEENVKQRMEQHADNMEQRIAQQTDNMEQRIAQQADNAEKQMEQQAQEMKQEMTHQTYQMTQQIAQEVTEQMAQQMKQQMEQFQNLIAAQMENTERLKKDLSEERRKNKDDHKQSNSVANDDVQLPAIRQERRRAQGVGRGTQRAANIVDLRFPATR